MAVLQNENHELVISAVSTWEIAIKYSIGKLKLDGNPQRWIPEIILKMGLQQLPISQRHTLRMSHLPFHHKDPFDRLLAGQAQLEKMALLSPDKIFKKYKVTTIW